MQSKPHVVVVTNHWGEKASIPWAGIFVERQIASLERGGVRVTTFDIGRSHSLAHVVGKWLELRKLVHRLDPDLVHAQYGTITGFVSTFVSKPTVISFCGNDLLDGASISNGRKYLGFFLSNVAALRARGIVCKSAQLRQALWWCQDRAVVIPNGVDLSLFVPGPQNEARKRLEWNLESPIAIINAGSDPKRKGVDLVQAAMDFVRMRLPNAELRVISKVEPTQMVLHYQAADALVCASLSEGSPNVVKEALACNLPIVSIPVGDVPERLRGVHPSAVVPRDAKSMGEAIAQVLLDRRRSNGREYVENLSLENVAQHVVNVYRTVLGD